MIEGDIKLISSKNVLVYAFLFVYFSLSFSFPLFFMVFGLLESKNGFTKRWRKAWFGF